MDSGICILKDELLSNASETYVKAGGIMLPEKYKDLKKDIDELEVYDTDIWICSFPRSGTTWTQEMIWLIANNLNFEGAKVNIFKRFPYLDMECDSNVETEERLYKNSIEMVKSMKSPRFIKTHLPLKFCPLQLRDGIKKPKIIYVARDPRDVCVSFFHHSRLFNGCKLDFEEYSKRFLAGDVFFVPFWEHVLPFWEMRKQSNVLFLKYEDLKKDLKKVIRQIAKFLNRDLNQEDVEKLANHLSFDSMQKNPALNREKMIKLKGHLSNLDCEAKFFRKGITGDYKNVMDSETVDKFNKWIEKNIEETDYCI